MKFFRRHGVGKDDMIKLKAGFIMKQQSFLTNFLPQVGRKGLVDMSSRTKSVDYTPCVMESLERRTLFTYFIPAGFLLEKVAFFEGTPGDDEIFIEKIKRPKDFMGEKYDLDGDGKDDEGKIGVTLNGALTLFDKGTQLLVIEALEGNDNIFVLDDKGVEDEDGAIGEGFGSATFSLDGGPGDDTISASKNTDYIFGGTGFDNLFANEGDDRVFAGPQGDTIFGSIGEDRLYGGKGHDFIDAGGQNDSLFGRMGNDTLMGDEGFDGMIGDAGDDVFYASEIQFGIIAGYDGDTIYGGLGNDTAYVDPTIIPGGSLFETTAGVENIFIIGGIWPIIDPPTGLPVEPEGPEEEESALLG